MPASELEKNWAPERPASLRRIFGNYWAEPDCLSGEKNYLLARIFNL